MSIATMASAKTPASQMPTNQASFFHFFQAISDSHPQVLLCPGTPNRHKRYRLK
jgi:hypothetical protein